MMVEEERERGTMPAAVGIGTDLDLVMARGKGKMKGLLKGRGNILRVGRRIGTRAVQREGEEMVLVLVVGTLEGIGERILAEIMIGRGRGSSASVVIGKGVIVLRLIASSHSSSNEGNAIIVLVLLVLIGTGIVIVNVKGAEDSGINRIDTRLRLILVKGLLIGFRLTLVVVLLLLPVIDVTPMIGVIQGREITIEVISRLPRLERAIPLERIRTAHLLVTIATGIGTETGGCLRPVVRR